MGPQLTSLLIPGALTAPDGQRQAKHLCLWGRCPKRSQESASSQEGAFRHIRGPGGTEKTLWVEPYASRLSWV